MGKGQVKIVADRDTKIKGLNQIMHHYTGKSDYEFNENVLERTAVIKISCDRMVVQRTLKLVKAIENSVD